MYVRKINTYHTVKQAGLNLYGSRGSRSPLIEWYLVEIGKEYTHMEGKPGLLLIVLPIQRQALIFIHA